MKILRADERMDVQKYTRSVTDNLLQFPATNTKN